MNLLERGAVAYGVLSIAFPLMAESIKSNGMAVPSNPAWLLISGIRNILIVSWVLLLVGFVAHRWWTAAQKHAEEREKRFKAKQEAKREARERAERYQRWLESNIEKLKKQGKELRDELKGLKAKVAELEKPKKETLDSAQPELEPEKDSMALALKEFG